MKRIRRIAVTLILCLLLQEAGTDLVWETEAVGSQLPMDEYYQQVMVEGKSGADVANTVSISDWQDYLLFRKCLTRKNATRGVRFVQEGDIKASEASFSYDENSDRTAIYQKGVITGAIGRDKKIFKSMAVMETISLSSIGLETACISNDTGDSKFYGTYDGGGYSISGLIFDSADPFDSGLFGWIYEQGAVQNVNIRDCCMMYPYGVISGYNLGRIENCTVSDTVGFGFSIGGVAGINDGTIQNCKVTGCEFMRGSLQGDLYGGVGGIVSCMILGTARSCDVQDTTLRGFEEMKTVLGGITGTQESNTPLNKGISCIDCVSDATLTGGYIMGGICGSMEDDWSVSYINAAWLRDCLFKGTIREKDQDICYAGGIIGRVRSDSEIYIADCISQGTIYRRGKQNRYSGAIGGILGRATGDAVIFSCTSEGRILEDEEENIREGQTTYIGGLVGEANRQLRLINCSSEGEITLSLSGSGDWIGGLVGRMSDNTRQYVANCGNSGDLTGCRTAGLAGIVEQGDNAANTGMKIENCVNSGSLQGTETGGLADTITSGGCLRCYTTHTGPFAVNPTDAVMEECYSLTGDQRPGLAGTMSEGAQNMTGMLTYGYKETYDYAPWRAEGERWPVPKFEGEYSYPALTTLNEGADSSAGRVEDPEPEETPDPTPSHTPTPPSSDPSTVPTEPSAEPTPTVPGDVPGSPIPTHTLPDSDRSDEDKESMIAVKQFRVKGRSRHKVVLGWKKNKEVEHYILYRSKKKKSGYKKIAKIQGSKGSYTDRSVSRGRTYYYRIKACWQKDRKKEYSQPVSVKAKVPYLARPVIELSKGKLDSGTRYMQIFLKKTDGLYVQVYLRQKGKVFIRAKLEDEKLSHFKKRIRFSYSKGNRTYICKIRTYRYIKGKKRYSDFSKIKRIKL